MTSNNNDGLIWRTDYAWGESDPYQAFDRDIVVGHSSHNTSYRTFVISENQVAVVGWYDVDNTQGPAILKQVIIEHWQNWFNEAPFYYEIGHYFVEGYNALTQSWEIIAEPAVFGDTNTEALIVDIESHRAYSGFRLVMDRLHSGHDSVILQEVTFQTESLSLFDKAGLEGVNLENYVEHAQAISTQATADRDTGTKLQNLIDATNNTLASNALVEARNFITDNNDPLTLEELKGLEIEGLTQSNLGAVTTRLQRETVIADEAALVELAGEAIKANASDQVLAIAGRTRSFFESDHLRSFVPQITGRDDQDYQGLEAETLNDVEDIRNTQNQSLLFNDNFDDTLGFHSDGSVTESDPVVLGWKDETGQNSGLLQRIDMHARDNFKGRLPKDFIVEGYDAVREQWVGIQKFENLTTPTGDTLSVDVNSRQAFQGFRIVVTEGLSNDNTSELNFMELDFMTHEVTNHFKTLGWDVRDDEVIAVSTHLADENLAIDKSDLSILEGEVKNFLIQNRIEDYLTAFDKDYAVKPTVKDFIKAGYQNLNEDNIHTVLKRLADDNITSPTQSDVDTAISVHNSLVAALAQIGDNGFRIISGRQDFTPNNLANSDVNFNQVLDYGTYAPRNAFDDNFSTIYASVKATDANPAHIGYVSTEFDLAILKTVKIYERTGYPQTMPNDFDIEGYNPSTQSWEVIRTVTQDFNSNGVATISINSDQAHSGFRLMVRDGVQGEGDYNFQLDELVFEVDSFYDELGISGVTAASSAEINKMLAYLADNGATLSAKLMQSVVDTYNAGFQLIEKLDSSLTDEAEELNALHEMLAKVAFVSTFDNVPAYEGQADTGISLTEAELDLILSLPLEATTFGRFVDLLIHSKDPADYFASVVAAGNNLKEKFAKPAYLLGLDVNGDGDYSDLYETDRNNSFGEYDGDNTKGDSTISVYLDIIDATSGDFVELYVEGALIATSAALTDEQINDGTIKFASSDGSSVFDVGAHVATTGTGEDDDRASLEVRVRNLQGVYAQDEGHVIWEYQW